MKRRQFYQTIARTMDLLGNPLRLAIYLKVLAEGCDCDLDSQRGYAGNCVTSLVKELKLPQSTVSSYLGDLSDGGLIECKKNGQFVYCKPRKETLVAMKSFIDSSLARVRPN